MGYYPHSLGSAAGKISLIMALSIKQFEKKIRWLLRGTLVLSLAYAIFSYSLTDPNLVLTSWQPYWNFQQLMWQYFFNNRQLLTITYGVLIVGWFALYLWGLKLTYSIKETAQQQTWLKKRFFIGWLIAISPLLLSYNALSHDVFNYIFNAKIVWVYQANPHVSVALDFATDNWTRFMHNTHTPAPYGYGWTALSLIPYALGFHKFLPTWLIFRLFAVLSVGLLLKVLQKLSRQLRGQPLSFHCLWLVFFNPLLIIEVVSNQHNDLWMMVPALAAFWLIMRLPTKHNWPKIVGSAALLAFSISIKLGTAVLLPFWLIGIARAFWPKIKRVFSWERLLLFSSIALFIPLLTERSQQFLPWYLLWSLVWLSLVKARWWRAWVLVFSFTALLRYLPWLQALEYNGQVLLEQKWLLWGGGFLLWFSWYIWSVWRQMRYNKTQ